VTAFPAPVEIEGDEILGRLGYGADARVDLDGDGVVDLAAGTTAGVVGVWSGPLAPAMGLGDAAWLLTGPEAEADFGGYLRALPDLDDDGVAELLVASRCDAWVYDAAGTEPPEAWAGVVGALDTRSTGSPEVAAWASDLDGDGAIDLVLGGPRQVVATGSGVLLLYPGPLGGLLEAEDASRAWAGDPETGFGRPLVGAGDVDADGWEDLVVVAESAPDLRSGAGILFLLAAPGR
jgi:hypothetical protein